MDQSDHQVISDLPLERLIACALDEFKKLSYSRRTLRRYHTIWRHLVSCCRQWNLEDHFSEELATRFLDRYRVRDSECLKPSEAWRRHIAIGLKMLGNFACEGRIVRCRVHTPLLEVPVLMKKPLQDYEQYCKDRRHHRPSTVHERIQTLTVFLDFLGSRNLTALDQMQPADLCAFVSFLSRVRPGSVSRALSDVRQLLRFLLLRGVLQRDLSCALPTIRCVKDATIPSVWDPELLVRLLKTVDRCSPRGKRDYAILLLACRLGLRLGDIRTLKLDDLKWDAATIEITQSKTGAPLCLPLTEEIGIALIDYLKSARPQSTYREVFLSLRPPCAPFAENTRLHHVVTYWRELAGIEFRTKQRHGLHSLRHTLATQLLREETPFHVISEILGHATTASTMIYAKADVEGLRGAALDTEEVRHVE